MQRPIFHARLPKSVVATLTLAAAICLGVPDLALAATLSISSQTGSYDCRPANPGDTIVLASGMRGPLKIQNCNGTADRPITIKNDPNGSSPTTINRSAGSDGGFVFSCDNCIGVTIDGSAKWRGAPSGKTYGIKVTMTGGGSPAAFVRLGGMSRFVTIRNIEVDGKWPDLAKNGIGISVNDHSISRSQHPGVWREGITIEHNYVHDIEGEGMYVGPNYKAGDLPLRNIEIAHNVVEDIGWEGINAKSWVAGDNSIHHNVVRRAGSNGAHTNSPSQYAGINSNSGTVRIYSNWVEDTGTNGIKLGSGEGPLESEGFGPLKSHVWNNVIVNAGGLWRTFMDPSYGIGVSAKEGVEKPIVYIYSNTIVSARNIGVNVANNAGVGYINDNIVAGAGGTPIKAPASIPLSNNRTGAVSDILFVDAGRKNFRLRPESPARNKAGNNCPELDFDGVPRPQDGVPDQGAFEFTSGEVAAIPQAPSNLIVE
jgi:hypothetical protein